MVEFVACHVDTNSSSEDDKDRRGYADISFWSVPKHQKHACPHISSPLLAISTLAELHFSSAVWCRHVLPLSYLYKSLTNPCSQEEAVHVLFSHAARPAPGGQRLKTATAL